jgi:ubiquinol-cytochrome c reductase cytochrome c subunit
MLIRLSFRVLLPVLLLSPFVLSQETESAVPDGKALFLQHCAKCHGETGQGVNAAITFAGPNIQAVHDSGSVMTAMEVGPSHMPSFAYVLSVPEMHAVADYVTQRLAIIPITGGDPSEGGKLFRIYCAACHRTMVRGGALAFAGTNAPDLARTSAPMIAGMVRFGPGPMPSFSPSVLDDKQLASIVEYVKFVQHPPSPGGIPLHWYGPVAEGCAAWIVLFGVLVVTGWIERGGKG